MKLLTKALIKQFPKLGETEKKKTEEIKIIAKFFTPWTSWTWFATEYDGADTFFGYVKGMVGELGYFSLSELQDLKGIGGLKVERDLYFKGTLQEVLEGKTYR